MHVRNPIWELTKLFIEHLMVCVSCVWIHIIISCWHMHIHRRVKTANNMIKQCVLGAKLKRINTKHSRNLFHPLKHTVFLINCVPNVASVISCVTFFIFLQIYENYIVIFWILIRFAPLVPRNWTFLRLNWFWRGWKSQLMIIRHRNHLRLVLFLLVFPKLRDWVVTAFTNCAFVWIAHSLLSPEWTFFFYVYFVGCEVWRLLWI